MIYYKISEVTGWHYLFELLRKLFSCGVNLTAGWNYLMGEGVNNISTIFQLYRSFIGGGNRNTQRKPPTCRKSLTNVITLCCIEYTSSWAGFELIILLLIGTDYTGSFFYNAIDTVYNTIQDARQFKPFGLLSPKYLHYKDSNLFTLRIPDEG
jgi:hypothetical protein